METGLIVLDSEEGVYRPTDKLVEFLNTDIHSSTRHYNYVKLMKNNTEYTLYKEPIIGHGFNTPMQLQIKTTNNANYGDPIPIFVY
jgi:hypothetical protein